MLPDNVLSTQPIPDGFIERVRDDPLLDYEMGGIAIGDASAGLMYQQWSCGLAGDDVQVWADQVPPTTLFVRQGITELALAFDQAMRPAVAFVDGIGCWLWWWDATVGNAVFQPIPDASSPRLCLDDKRQTQVSVSDVLLAYMRGHDLCVRVQRERFSMEHVLRTDAGSTLVDIGMNRSGRVQFWLRAA